LQKIGSVVAGDFMIDFLRIVPQKNLRAAGICCRQKVPTLPHDQKVDEIISV